MCSLLLGDDFPDFKAETTHGDISFHSYLGDKWGLLFSHPGDFTPVCTTELGQMVKLAPEFEKRNVKMTAISVDTVENGLAWIKDINAFVGNDPDTPLSFPIIGDNTRSIAVLLGMVKPASKSTPGLPLSARHVFILDPAKKLKCVFIYPASTGRYFKELLRAIDSLQLTEKYGVSTEAEWQDINSYNCEEPTETLPFPIIADPKRDLAVKLGMLDPDEKDLEGMPVTARCVFIIGPDKKMKLSILYPATTGRNFDEILRVVDSLQLTATHNVATPVDWKETKSTFTCACCLPGMNMGFLDKVVNINTKPTTSVCENFNVFQMLMSTSRIKWKLWLLEDIFNSRRRSCVKSEEMEVHDQNASTSCTCSSYQEFLPRRFQK
uniref:Thioredoxin domain-containing protein n=1 Tax=Leptobrachium leishanense TaxID=445787 RepID=A0A8C5RDD6_9ANUR